MGNARGKLLFGTTVVLLGAALFVVTSAYVIDHGYSRVGAAIAGALAFPLLPLGWHLLSERRRAKRVAAAKVAPKAALTGHDRFWLRFALVAVAFVGAMVVQSGTGVVGAVWRHGLWFVPASQPDVRDVGNTAKRDFAAQEHLLKRVPSDAELVVVVHPPPPDAVDHSTADRSMVFAYRPREAMIASDAAAGDMASLDDINSKRDQVPWLKLSPFTAVDTTDPIRLFASDGWRSKVDPPGTGPSEELRGELTRAPQDAIFVAAFTPRTQVTVHDLDALMIRHGVMWGGMQGDSIVLAGRLEATDATAAQKLVDDVNKLLHLQTTDIPESCRDTVAKIVDHVEIARDGAIVTARAELGKDALAGLMFCGMK
jgi:hypothetical protein